MQFSNSEGDVLTDKTLQILAQLSAPIWIYDLQAMQVVWANAKTFEILRVPSLEAINHNTLKTPDLAPSQIQLAQQEKISVDWTVVHSETISLLKSTCSGVYLNNGRFALLVEASSQVKEEVGNAQASERVEGGEVAIGSNSSISFEQIVETSQEGVWVINSQGETIYVNPEMARLLGYSVEEMLGRSLFDFMDETWGTYAEELKQRRERGISEDLRFCFLRSDGSPLWTDCSTNPLYDQKGNYIGAMALIKDISDRVQVEQALCESEQRYQLAAEGARVGVWDWNRETNEFYSPNLKQLLGYEDDEVSNQLDEWLQKLVHPDDLDGVKKTVEAYLTGKRSTFELEHRMIHKNGDIIWFLARGEAQRNQQGKIARIVGSNTDITARKAAELLTEKAQADRDKRDKYLRSLAKVQKKLLTALDITPFLYQEVVKILGKTAQVSRAYIFQASQNEKQQWFICQQAQWCADGITPQRNEVLLDSLRPSLGRALSEKEVYLNQIRELPVTEQAIWRSWGIQSTLILPLLVNQEVLGFVGFDQCDYEREWTHLEVNLLQWSASAIAIGLEKQQSQQALLESEKKYRSIFENITQGIFQITSQGKYISANPFLAKLYGYQSSQELIQTITDVAQQLYVNPKRRQTLNELTLEYGTARNFESQVYHKDGRIIWISETQHAVYDQQGNFLYFEGVVEDISARKKAEDQLHYQAFHDGLTNLSNRTWFVQRLEGAIYAYKQGMTTNCYAVFFIDLDRFKIINDSLGHLIGDELLKKVAQRLDENISSEQLLARFGGDEFALLVTNIVDQNDCDKIAEKILNSFKKPFVLKENRYLLGASIGIAMGDIYYQTPEQVLRDADAAMYEAKDKKIGYAFFQPEIRERVLSSLLLEQELEGAIQRKEFELFYQPLVYLENHQLYGFEVLLRWFHPQRGAISPARFIPIAEQSNLIKDLDAWVFRESCRQFSQWQNQFAMAKDLVMSVNLSPINLLKPNLVKQIETTLQETKISPHSIRLEITETAFLDDDYLKILQQLETLGVQISIDDFGTGESSLSRLHKLPLSTLKIDKAFVQELEQSYSSETIAQTIITLAEGLKIKTLAEGIETAQQREILLGLGCLLGQGYFYSPPVTTAAATKMLQADRLNLS